MPSYQTTQSMTSFYGYLVFAEAALLARNDTEGLAKAVTRHLAQFAGLHEEELELWRLSQQVAARVRIGDQVLDEALRGVQVDVLGEVKQDRSKPAYQNMFKDGLGELIKYGIDQQVKVVREVLGLLEAKEAPYSAALVKAHAPKLKAAIKQAEEAIAARDALAIKQTLHQNKAQAWKQDANAVFMAVEGDLLKLASGLGEKKAWTRAFFAGR